jgi:ATP-dependent DNA helicase RecG
MSADEKDATMASFQRGAIDVLVATTVIEVGVDVPNASIMVVEHAERFGLSQMHQLRGRIGRGTAQSFCVLMTGGKVSVEAEARLDAMVRTQNGFEIAELDLQQRGPGEFFGTKQAGMPNFRVANLLRDRDILELARSEARLVVEGPNEQISKEEIARAVQHLRSHWNRRYGLVEVG